MSDWCASSVDAIVSVLRRGSAPVYVASSPVLAIGQRCVRNEGFDISPARPHMEFVPVAVEPVAGDVLLNSTGTGTIGRSCVFPRTSGRFMVDGHVTVLRGKRELVDGRILNELLQSPVGQRLLETRCFTGSTNQVELSRSELARTEFALPPLEEQLRIAEILDTIDETIQATERVIIKLSATHVGLGRSLVGAWDERDIVWSDLGALIDPKRPIVYGILMPGENVHGGVPVIKVRDIKNGVVAPRSELLHTSPAIDNVYARSRVRTGDILFTIRGTVGRTATVDSSLDNANITQDTARLALNGVDSDYLEAAMELPEFRSYIAVHTIGQAVKGINLRELRRAPIPMEPIDRQRAIGATLRASKANIRLQAAALNELRKTRSGLAADLLSGRVRTLAS